MTEPRPVVDLIAGARPNFMKLAPVVRGLLAEAQLSFRIVHTGQHYDEAMSSTFFEQLGIPAPDVHLGAGPGTHGAQTARILERYEALLFERPASGTVVFGDVNSTIACAMAASKVRVPVAHVEAGLRSFDRTMPEEINRILTDAIADLLLVTEESGLENLLREGVPREKARLVGNVMIDSLLDNLPQARDRRAAAQFGLAPRQYGFITLHRPSNVDTPAVLATLVELFTELARDLPLVFALHPRTRQALDRCAIGTGGAGDGLICIGPQSYLDTVSLVADAAVVLTDSGGLQEETSVLGIPCLTLRENTERPVTVLRGTSRLVGNNPDRIRACWREARRGNWPKGTAIPLWDGRAGRRVAQALGEWMGLSPVFSTLPRCDGRHAHNPS